MPDVLLDRVVAAIGDRYDVEGELGRGGMAVVYRARDVRLRRPVALKVLPPDLAFRDGVRARFLREAETAAQLSHPNVVPIYAADETNGVAWLAMALIAGETLGARMAREPRMPVDEARRVLAEVADALAYAHARGVVHRDIKPDNILLDAESGRALVTDFGIARAAEADERLTMTGIAVGTPTYMSPEQALGEREIDGRSDLYSLGAVGYQMLAGTPPFAATSAAALLMKHVSERPRPIAEVRPDLPPALAYAIDRVLAKKPEARWADAAAFRRALLAESAPAAPATLFAPVAPRVPNGPSMSTATLDWRTQREEAKQRLREQQQEWRARKREQRAEWKDAVRDAVQGNLPVPAAPAPLPWAGGPAMLPNDAPALPLERLARAFRRRVVGSAMLLAFLTFINLGTMAASGFPFPWVIFPAMGIIGGLRRRWRPMAREGLRFSDVMFGGAYSARATVPPPDREPLADAVRRLRSRVTLGVGAAIASAVSFTIGASLNADPMIIPFVGFLLLALFAAQSVMFTMARVRRSGLSFRQAMSSRWEDAAALADRRPREAILAEEAGRLVSADVLAGPYGRIVRGAADDRIMVRETLAKLSPADRAILPKNVLATIDELVAKVAGLAQSLHRLDDDVSPAQLEQLEARIAAAEREPGSSPDRARKLELLQRQRVSVHELLERRTSLSAQMESAHLVLQNIKLDLIKLRSSGVGAGIGDASTATQEARALSRDIQYALEAAGELRSL